MKNNIFKILVLAVFSTSPLFCYANNTIMIKGNIVEDTCSTKSNEIEGRVKLEVRHKPPN
ncbi:hypothetical protein PK64_19650 [Acinetobacter baumannii]|nr:hypothetical protein PK64_19650 [Acinetobacter baumannii]